MSILIRGMEMPKDCKNCPMLVNYICIALGLEPDWGCSGRDERCPLVPVPPHGRLIDADALFREISNRTNAAYEWRRKATDEDIQARAEATYMAFVEVALTISNLPTIVEAEGE